MFNHSSDKALLNARKGSRWEIEEVNLIVELREKWGLSWSEIAKVFEEKWPGKRSKGTIQVKYSAYKAQHKIKKIQGE